MDISESRGPDPDGSRAAERPPPGPSPAPGLLLAVRRCRTPALLLAVGVLSAGCDGPPGAEERLLPGSVDSLEEVGREVLAGLSARDTARLGRIRLTEREHNEAVWPELPASNPAAGFPLDVAWTNIQLRNEKALQRLLTRYGGRRLVLEEVACRGETREFESFQVRTDCGVRFRVNGDTVVREQLFKHVLVWDGEHKIFRYYDGSAPAGALESEDRPAGTGVPPRGSPRGPVVRSPPAT